VARALEEMPVYHGLLADFDYRPGDHTSIDLSDYQFLVVQGGVFRRAVDPPSCEETGKALGIGATGQRAPGT
jgi:hypothetical protein